MKKKRMGRKVESIKSHGVPESIVVVIQSLIFGAPSSQHS